MDLITRLRAPSPPLLWDGGVGTALIGRGLRPAEEPPEAWLMRRPDDVRAVHEGFASAGCDVLQTCTFGLPRLLLDESMARHATSLPPLGALIGQAAALCQQAIPSGRSLEIVASLGPSWLADPDPGRITEAYAQLASQLVEAGVSTIHLETVCDPRELAAAVRGVRAGGRGALLLVSLTLHLGNSGLETPLGIPLAEMLRVMETHIPDAAGVNCSLSARRMVQPVAMLRGWAGRDLPIIAQPQVDGAGPDCKRSTFPEKPEQFAHSLRALLDAGASAVGGCCGCTASHLAAARQVLGSMETDMTEGG